MADIFLIRILIYSLNHISKSIVEKKNLCLAAKSILMIILIKMIKIIEDIFYQNRKKIQSNFNS